MEQLLSSISVLENEDNSSQNQSNALADVKRQLESSILNLPEKHFLRVLKGLYLLVEIGKRHYERAKPSSKGKHHNHLTQLGQVIVDALAHALDAIKFKVIRQFLEHMLEILPCEREIVLDPVKNMYLRMFHLILCNHQHLAHLDQDLWYQCVVFSSSTLESHLSLVDQHEIPQYHASAHTGDFSAPGKMSHLSIESLTSCLARLLSWPAARITVGIAERLVRVIGTAIDHGKRTQKMQSSVFCIVKHMLANFASSNMYFACVLASLIFKTLPIWWITKNMRVRKELQACLMLSVPYLRLPLARNSMKEEDIRNITQYLFTDYFSRSEMLDTSNIHLLPQKSIGTRSTFRARGILLTFSPDHEATEETWYFLQSLAHLLCSQELSLGNTVREHTQNRKRVRLPSIQDCLYDNLESTDTTVLKQALQILLMTYELGYRNFMTSRTLERLQSLLSQSDFELLNWTNLCLSSLLYNLEWGKTSKINIVGSLQFDVGRLWSTTIAGLSSTGTSRTSSFLATTLLLNDLITEDRVCKYVRNLVDRIGNSSPCLLDDAACTFLLCIFDRSLQANYVNSKQAAKIASDFFSAQVRSIRMNDLLFTNRVAVTTFVYVCYNWDMLHKSKFIGKQIGQEGILSLVSKHVIRQRCLHLALRGDFGRIFDGLDAIEETLGYSSYKYKVPEFQCIFDGAMTNRMKEVHQIINSDIKSFTARKDLIFEAIFLVFLFSRCAKLTQLATHSETIDHLVTLIISALDRLKLEEEDYMLLTSIGALVMDYERPILLPTGSDVVSFYLRLLIFLQTQALQHLKARSTQAIIISSNLPNYSSQDVMPNGGQARRQGRNKACVSFSLLSIILRTTQSSDDTERWEADVIALFQLEDPQIILESPVFSLLWSHIPLRVAGRLVSWGKLLEFITTHIVQDYRYERLEYLHLFLMRIIEDTITHNDQVNRGISENWITQILNWLLQLSLTTSASSYTVRLQMVHLLTRITCKTALKCKRFALSESPALTKHLFQCLQDDDLRVVLAAGMAMSEVFEQFETHMHQRIYQDIAKRLEAGPALPERLIVKTVILANLGTTVESIRHLAIIGLINVGQAEALESYVAQAIHFLADNLNISQRILLQRFQRTTFRAWISTKQDITRFPYMLFGLDNSAFIDSFGNEIAAQSFLSGYDDEFARVCKYLDKSAIKAVQDNLCLIRVYRDVLSRQSNSDISDRISALLEKYISAGVLDSENFGWDLRFGLLYSDHESTNLAVSATLDSLASRYEALVQFLGASSDVGQPEALQYSWETFISSVAPRFPLLRAQDLIAILQKLFQKLWHLAQGPGFSMETRRIVRKVGLLVTFYHDGKVSNYVLDRILRGLSSILGISTDFQTQHLANKVAQYILMNVSGQDLDRPWISIALLFMAEFIQSHDIKSASSFDAWLQCLKSKTSSGQRAMIETLANIISNTKIEISVLISSTKYASKILCNDQSCSNNQGKAKFLGLLTGVVTLEMLENLELVKTLNSFFHGIDNKCTDPGQRILLSQIEGALLLHCCSLSPENLDAGYNAEPGILSALDSSVTRSLCYNVELSLLSYDMDVVSSAEHVLGQILHDKLPDIVPYITTDVLQSLPLCISDEPVSKMLHNELLDNVLSTETNPECWTISLLRFLLTCSSDRKSFRHMCQMSSNDISFATLSIPILATTALKNSHNKKDDFHNTLVQIMHRSLSSPTLIRERVLTCIAILQHLRLTYWKNGTEVEASIILSRLEVNYLEAALAAEQFGYYEDALLFLQLFWTQADMTNLTQHRDQIHTLRKRIFKRLPDPDSFYGVPVSPSITSSMLLAEHEQDNIKLLQLSSAIANSERYLDCSIYPFKESIKEDSLFELGHQSRNPLSQFCGSTERSEAEFFAALKMRQWNLPFLQGTPRGAYECLYRAHVQMARGKETNTQLQHDVNKAIRDAHVALQTLSPVSDSRLRSVIAGCMLEMEEIFQSTRVMENSESFKTMSSRTSRMVETLNTSDYDIILACRHTMLDHQHSMTSKRSPRLSNKQIDLLLSDYTLVAETGDFVTALPIAALCEKLLKEEYLTDNCADMKARAQALISQILWQIGEHSASVQLLAQSIDNEIDAKQPTALSTATNLLNIGLRSAAAKLRNPQDILDLYLIRAVETLHRTADMTAGPLFLKFALFCDTQLQNLSQTEHFEELDFLGKQKLRDISDLSDLLRKTQSVAKKQEYKLQIAKIQALHLEDKQEIQSLARVKSSYLCRSIAGFLQAFASTEDGNIYMSRCTTLWFAHSHDSEAAQVFEANWTKVPSHKYLLLLDQFLARLTTVKSGFQDTLHALIERLITEHPYHTLYPIYAIQFTTKLSDVSAIQRQKVVTQITRRATETMGRSALLKSISKLCSNYVSFATMQLDKREFAARTIPISVFPYYKVFTVESAGWRLPPLTMRITPRASQDYSDVPRIATYRSHFQLASGISMPKVLTCRLTDGSTCKELVKAGHDDLRQDAVMQRVFSQVNELFGLHRATRQRQLKVRTYKVLSLTPKAGVLEWVKKTVPLQDLLQPLHERYNIGDWTYTKCRKKIAEASKGSKSARLSTYQEVTLNCAPVMYHAFIDNFSDALSWYTAQLAFSRSSAVISIVGHVLGLGDRHLHNILFDKSKGEVVHIDLGIAFEQGKLLPIPETVPFRLTRDVVNGMGISGVEGVFRRCCEFTLDVMRKEKRSIDADLDVLRYDPLYDWILPSIRAGKAQDNTLLSDTSKPLVPEVGSEATRALLSVQRKLVSDLSVSAVVSGLIMTASDPQNLALLFAGWSAWY